MPHLDELIPLAQAARRLPDRPHASALWRWCRLGIRGRGGDRVRLEHTRIGMRLYTTEAWLSDFGRRLEEADREHFDARHVDREQHRRKARARRSSSSSSQRLAAAEARLEQPAEVNATKPVLSVDRRAIRRIGVGRRRSRGVTTLRAPDPRSG